MSEKRVRGRDCPRVFVTDSTGTWTELTAGGRPVVRLTAPDLREAQRRRRRLPADVPVILDVTVSVADDSRTALAAISAQDGPKTVQ